ncbi:MAG: EF-P lysine aminoacylase EpmA [Woeseiaceae bacterium]
MADWRPTSGPDVAASRAQMLQRVRAYFRDEDVLEVDTPALSPFAVSDTHIESFAIETSAISCRPLYLRTSPEFHMKRLLAAGYPDIFSIGRVFRDGEAGRRHQPEFTMIEWYRLGMQLDAIIDDTLQIIAAALADAAPDGAPQVLDYRRAFAAACDIDIETASIAVLADAAGVDDRLRQAIGSASDEWLDLLLTTRVVPSFPPDRLTVLRHFPASQAALARLCPADPTVADRFEVFLGTVELANGYVELTDADEQAMRIESDNDQRRRRGLPVRPVDRALLEALRSGLPQCAGVAMGLERLQMLHAGVEDMREVVTFNFQGST